MLRHYSSTRLAVLSITIPICLAIFGWILSLSQQKELAIYLLIAEGILFSYALGLSLFFSTKYEQTRQFLVKVEAGEIMYTYNSIVGSRLRNSLQLDAIDKTLIIIGLSLHLAFYVSHFT